MSMIDDRVAMRWLRRSFLAGRMPGDQGGQVRLQTLVILRWLAIAGQLVAVLVVHFAMGFPLPLGLCLAVIAASGYIGEFYFYRKVKHRYHTVPMC